MILWNRMNIIIIINNQNLLLYISIGIAIHRYLEFEFKDLFSEWKWINIIEFNDE